MSSVARLSARIHQVSTGRVALAALAGFLLFTALILPGQAARAKAVAGGAGSPDLSFYYTPTDLYRMAEAYGEAGRAAYVHARFTFDVVWPLVYTVFLSTGISWVFRKGAGPDSHWQRANLLPLAGAGADFLENVSASAVMVRYPRTTPVVDVLTPIFTMAKWVLVNGSFVLLVAGVVAATWQWRQGRALRKAI